MIEVSPFFTDEQKQQWLGALANADAEKVQKAAEVWIEKMGTVSQQLGDYKNKVEEIDASCAKEIQTIHQKAKKEVLQKREFSADEQDCNNKKTILKEIKNA